MKLLELDVVATRGADVESRHRVHAAVVGDDDRPIRLDAGEAIVHREPAEALSGEPYRPWSMLVVARTWPVPTP